jgi:outer membrane biosynthesis protein TonB
MARLGSLGEWLDATARNGAPAVCFSSCFPYVDEVALIVPPRSVWPPAAPTLSARVRWKSVRFVPLEVVQAILAGQRVNENGWCVDGPSECLVPAGRPGPFRTSVRPNAAVDRLTGATERHTTACVQFRPGAGLWTIVSFSGDEARERWLEPVKAAFRLLADSGFGGERSRGWGRSEQPEFIDGMLPEMILPEISSEELWVEEAAVESVAAEVVQAPETEPAPVEEPPAEQPAAEPPVEEPPAPAPSEPPVEDPPEPEPSEPPAEEAAASEQPAEPAEPAQGEAQQIAAPEIVPLSATGPLEPEAAAPESPAPAEPAQAPEPAAAAEAPIVNVDLHPHWLLSLFSPAGSDQVDWSRGSYSVQTRGGRIESPVRSGELKKQVQMISEGSVVYAAAAPRGAAPDVAPDGFEHPVYRAGFAVSIPLPEGK